jgi:ADP-ribosyl-[dinitrogen reductase] hydrolase
LGDEGDELIALLKDAASSVKKWGIHRIFADTLGLNKGVSGYVYHSVPVAYPCLACQSSRLSCGSYFNNLLWGDADSTGAIVGGIVGTAVGKAGYSR